MCPFMQGINDHEPSQEEAAALEPIHHNVNLATKANRGNLATHVAETQSQ